MNINRTSLKTVGLAVVILAMGTMTYAADGVWTNPAGGTWGDSGNWSNGTLPDNGHALITLTNTSFTVDYTAEGPAISNLFVRNKAGQRTTLWLSAPFKHAGGYISLSNATVYVTNNAVWSYPGTNNNADRLMDIGFNSEVVVCGGAVQFTNLLRSTTAQRSYINIGVSSTGTLRVASGVFNFYSTNKMENTSHAIFLGRYSGGVGTLEIDSGASMVMYQGGDNQLWPFYFGLNGGRAKTVVSGILNFTNSGAYVSVGANSGTYAELIVTNSGTIMGGGRWTVGHQGNAFGTIRFCGTTNMTHGTYGWSHLNIGFNNGENGCSTGLVEIVSGSIFLSGLTSVGVGEGSTNYAAIGTMNVHGGSMLNQTLYGVWIGWCRLGGRAEGTLNMTNGVMLISNGFAAQPLQYPAGVAPWGYPLCGLVVGIHAQNNLVEDTNAATRAKGTINLSGGVITNQYQLVLGVNGATGVLNQTGGRIMMHQPNTTNCFTIIGYGYGTNAASWAGHGTYNMSGGSYATVQRVFVGGVPQSVQWFARPGATGLLKVNGGSFAVSNTLYVGELGNGTVTMGSNGTLIASNLIATNSGSKLRFELGPNGVGSFTVTTNLAVSSATKLEVNATGFHQIGQIKLLDCKTRTGSIDWSNITVTGRGYVVQTLDEDIYYRNVYTGAIILVK